MRQDIDVLDQQVAQPNKKTKATIYLTEEAQKSFDELFISRFRKNRRIDRSSVACEALIALYKKETNEYSESF